MILIMKLVSFKVEILETNLLIKAERDLRDEARGIVIRYRSLLEDYIKKDPFFKKTLHPYKIQGDAPSIIKAMSEASLRVGVGPMAAVAGCIAEFVGMELLRYTREVIVDNGGDIFIKIETPRTIGIYAGRSPLSGTLCLEILPGMTPLGVCTSSGTFGHSMSLGKADAVVVLSGSTTLADAAATRICNLIQDEEDIPKGIDEARSIDGVKGVLIIKGNRLGVWGDLLLTHK